MSNEDTTQVSEVEQTEETETVEQEPSEDLSQPEIDDELAATKQQAGEYFEGWQRERAAFTNYKKRIERDLQDIRQTTATDTLMRLLPVIDDFERAMDNLPDELKDHAWLEGITAIQRKLLKTLEDQDIVAIDPVGQVFDPNLHEAVATDTESDMESGHVTTTLQKGYRCGDRVLRPALVRVAS